MFGNPPEHITYDRIIDFYDGKFDQQQEESFSIDQNQIEISRDVVNDIEEIEEDNIDSEVSFNDKNKFVQVKYETLTSNELPGENVNVIWRL